MKTRTFVLVIICLGLLVQSTFAQEMKSSFQKTLTGLSFHINIENVDLTNPEELPMELIQQDHLTSVQFWKQVNTQDDQQLDVLKTTAYLGIDIASLKEINLSAAAIWDDLSLCYQQNFDLLREEYFKGLPNCQAQVPQLQELNQKFLSMLLTINENVFAVGDNWFSQKYAKTPLSLHPLLMQFMAQYTAAIKVHQALEGSVEYRDVATLILEDAEKRMTLIEEILKMREKGGQLFLKYLNTGSFSFLEKKRVGDEVAKVVEWLKKNDPNYTDYADLPIF